MGYLSYRMFALQEDILKSQAVTNTFEGQFSEITIQDHHFLPSLAVDFPQSYNNKDKILREDGSIDLEQLQNYFLIEVSCNQRTKGKSTFVNYPIKQCSLEDFKKMENTEFDEGDEFHLMIKHRLCPDVPKDSPFYKLKNSYVNETERNSVSFEIKKCDSKSNKNCKSDSIIQSLAEQMVFTIYLTYGKLSFTSEISASPIVSTDGFHQ